MVFPLESASLQSVPAVKAISDLLLSDMTGERKIGGELKRTGATSMRDDSFLPETIATHIGHNVSLRFVLLVGT